MRRLILTAAALVGLASTASAQPNRNVIRDSGNGANNTIVARNGPAIQLYAPQGYAHGGFQQAGYAPDGFQGGYAPGGFQQGGYAPGVFAPQFGSVNRNTITNSGNGVGNTIGARNR